MLRIFVYGANGNNGYLDLDPSIELSMEETTPLFSEDLSIGEYSLPYDGILWTDNNRKLLGHAERIDSSTRPTFFFCTVEHNGWPEIVKGKLTLLTKAGRFNYRNGNFRSTISGSKGMFGSIIKNKTLKDLTLGGPITWDGMDSREYAYEVMTGTYPQLQFLFSFVPVAIETFMHTDRADYNGEFIAKDVVNNVVIDASQDWSFGRPDPDDPLLTIAAGEEKYLDYRTIPFFHVKNICRHCFEQFGYRVTGDFIDDASFANLVLFNNYAIEKYNLTTFLDENRQIIPANHLPKVPIATFLQRLFSFLNIKMDFGPDNTVTLQYRKNHLAVKTIFDIDDIVADGFETQFEEEQLADGFTADYAWDSADSYYSDRVKDLSTKTLCASVAKFSDLLTLNIGRDFTTDDIAFVEALNMYYAVADATTNPVLKWDAWAEALHPYKSGEGEETIDIGLSTLCQYVLFNETTGLVEKTNHLGTRQQGTYINNKGTLVSAEYDLRVFFAQLGSVAGVDQPLSFNHNRDANNTIIQFDSLQLSGEYGMVKRYLDAWHQASKNKEILSIKVNANAAKLEAIRKATLIRLKSVHFLLQRIERSINSNTGEPVKLFLVPL